MESLESKPPANMGRAGIERHVDVLLDDDTEQREELLSVATVENSDTKYQALATHSTVESCYDANSSGIGSLAVISRDNSVGMLLSSRASPGSKTVCRTVASKC